MSKGKGKGKAPAKPAKKPAAKKAVVKATPEKGGGGMRAKIFSDKRAEGRKSKGVVASRPQAKAVSGRTRIGEVPDALNIYKGKG